MISPRPGSLLSILFAVLIVAGPAFAGELELGGSASPVIAVNPNDPLQVAYASVHELRISTDGGATWTDPVRFPYPATHSVAPFAGGTDLAFDSSDRLFWTQKAISLVSGSQFATGLDILMVQCDPTTGAVLPAYPVNVSELAGSPGGSAHHNVSQILSIDDNGGQPRGGDPPSPFQDRMYIGWVRDNATTRVFVTHSTDQGMTWSNRLRLDGPDISEGLKLPMNLAIAKNGDVYATYHSYASEQGQVFVLRSTDGGVTFPQKSLAFQPGDAEVTHNLVGMPPLPDARFVNLASWHSWPLPDPLDPARVYIVTADDPDSLGGGDPSSIVMATSTDFGASWDPPVQVDDGPGDSFQVAPSASIDPETGEIMVVWYDNRNGTKNPDGDYLLDVFAAKSTDGGVTFSPDVQLNENPYDATGEAPLFGGAPCFIGCGEWYEGIWGPDPDNLFAVGFLDILHWDGTQWTIHASNPGGENWLASIWGTSSSDIFAVGLAGTIVHYDGLSWTPQTSGTSKMLWRVWGSSGTDVFAVGDDGTILRYDGAVWSAHTSGTTEGLTCVWGTSSTNVFAVGFGGTILRYDGASWSPQSSGTLANLYGVWGSSATDVFAIGHDGVILHTTDGGASWSPTTLPGDKHTEVVLYKAIWGSGANDVWVVGHGTDEAGRIVHWDGVSWSIEGPPLPILTGVWAGSGEMATVGRNGTIVHYDGSWNNPANPALPSANARLWSGDSQGINVVGGRVYLAWSGNQSDGGQQSIFFDDTITGIPTVILSPGSSAIAFGSASPNPFQRETIIDYSLSNRGSARLSIHDVAGRRVATLFDGVQETGSHAITWDGRDADGGIVASGIYFLRLESAGQTAVKRLTFTR